MSKYKNSVDIGSLVKYHWMFSFTFGPGNTISLWEYNSSIVIEVIRVILNLFVVFFTKKFYKHKKHKKHKNAYKRKK